MIRFEFVKNASEKAKLPVRSTADAAGYDFVTPVDVTINPGETVMVKTDVKVYMPKQVVLTVYPRSSMGVKKHVVLANSVGIIDADYVDNPDNEGNIGICLYNYGSKIQDIKAGERIAQGIFVRYETADVEETTGTRAGGFGSTGA